MRSEHHAPQEPHHRRQLQAPCTGEREEGQGDRHGYAPIYPVHEPASLEESGAVFGAGFGQRLRKIFAPLLTGNYAIGALLVFVKTLSEYGTPYTLGRRIGFYVFTTDIHRYSTTAPIDFGRSASLSSILACICMAMWLLQNDITGKNSYCLAAGNFTLDHYKELLTTPKALSTIWKSLFLAVSSATICSVIGTSVVAAVRKSKGFFKKTLEGVSLLPEMLPSIVLVFGIMLFWNQIYHVLPLYNTMGIMVLAYVVLFLPYTVQYVTSSFTQISDSLIAAGRVFGGKPLYILRHITLPIISPGIATGWMMTFIIAFRELVTASLIAPPNTLVVSTYIMREFEQGSVSVGMAMAVLCVLFTTTALLALNAAIDRSSKRG